MSYEETRSLRFLKINEANKPNLQRVRFLRSYKLILNVLTFAPENEKVELIRGMLLPSVEIPDLRLEEEMIGVPNDSIKDREANWERRPRPLRMYYENCGVCGESGCLKFHRWLTETGYVWMLKDLIMVNYIDPCPLSPTEFLAKAKANYGGSLSAAKVCTVCGQDCEKFHRYFTKEGYIWYLTGFFGVSENSMDSLVAIKKYADEHFETGNLVKYEGGDRYHREHFRFVIWVAGENAEFVPLLRSIETNFPEYPAVDN